ncbi:MAG: hypothetical protein Q4G68_08950 [Planctomycetia bacterium]|nr:hypothetical protein [Planctomycetia bacterium]
MNQQGKTLTILATGSILGFAAAILFMTVWTTSESPKSSADQEPWSAFPLANATASTLSEGVSLATGSFNGANELLYYLDSQSGRLTAALLARGEQAFTKLYTRNIKADLTQAAGELKMSTPPETRFIMVTGDADIRQVGAGEMNKVSQSFLYVAEINSGIVLVYAIPNEGDRDLTISNGEIIFWTFARLNNGLTSK